MGFYLDKVTPGYKVQPKGWDLTKENVYAYIDWLFEGENEQGAKDLEEAISVVMEEKMNSKMPESFPKATKNFGAALLAWNKGKASYPDANFTMRLTYGTVKPYSPKDGVSYWYWSPGQAIMGRGSSMIPGSPL